MPRLEEEFPLSDTTSTERSRVRRRTRAPSARAAARGRAPLRRRARTAPAPRRQQLSSARSCGVAEVDDIAVQHHVILPFQAQVAVFAARRQRSAREKVLVPDDFRTDEPALNVCMDFAAGILRVRAARNGPGAILIFSDREERDVTE